VALAATSLVCQ